MEQSRRDAVADRGGGSLNRVVIADIAIVMVSAVTPGAALAPREFTVQAIMWRTLWQRG